MGRLEERIRTDCNLMGGRRGNRGRKTGSARPDSPGGVVGWWGIVWKKGGVFVVFVIDRV